MAKLDEKDSIILNLLQENCRISLTEIAKKIKLSVDSVKKRIKKMQGEIYYPKIQIRPRSLGFNNIVDIKIKLNNHSQKDFENFIEYLKNNERIPEVFRISGEWDISIVVIAKNTEDFDDITNEIKKKYGKIITTWSESLTLNVYKFEKYNILNLLEIKK
jgi:Lrp/AsnC family transcriptional regulator, leucine-responsive regulatory protein